MTARKKLGFTLIELIVALVLSTLLLTAVIGTVGQLSKNTDYLTKDKPALWKQVAASRMQQEMMNGISYSLTKGSLEISGYSDHAYPSQASTLRKNSIRYRILKDSNGNFLIRETLVGQGLVVNLICDGIASIGGLDAQGKDFTSRSGGFNQNVSFRFLNQDGQDVFVVNHSR